MRTPVLICALVVAAAFVARPGRVRAAEEPVHELVVYVSNDDADVASVRSICNGETGADAPDEERQITTGDQPRGRYLVYRLRGTELRDVKRHACRIFGRRWVTDVFVNGSLRARGAPTQIAVVDGDLEPRSIGDQPAMDQVSMSAADVRGVGRGVVVAVLDGGFDLRHEFLADHLVPERWDTIDDDDDPQDLGNLDDDDGDGLTDHIVGHGTFTSSLVLAGAPGARVLPVRVLDDEGWGTPLSVAAGIQYATQHGAQVINMSLVIPTSVPVVRDAIRAAIDAGIVVVSAAGNGDGPTWQNDPQIAGRVITVGAVDAEDHVTDFSATGSFVHVYAPGLGIRGAFGGADEDSYAVWQGTSFAAPFVTATAAIARELAPALPPRDLRDVVMATARVIPGTSPTGRGRLDAAAAVEAVR